MLFGWEVEHPFVVSPIQKQIADVELLVFTEVSVLLKHVGKESLKLLGDALSHHPHGVDRVHQDMRW